MTIFDVAAQSYTKLLCSKATDSYAITKLCKSYEKPQHTEAMRSYFILKLRKVMKSYITELKAIKSYQKLKVKSYVKATPRKSYGKVKVKVEAMKSY